MSKTEKFYRYLLEKYSEIINEHESKTVGEIKALISHEDLTVQGLAQKFKGENYEYPKHYLKAVKKALSFLQNNIQVIEANLDFNYWLEPKEILEIKTCEEQDLNMFLCSILLALGDKEAKLVVAKLSNDATKSFVLTQVQKKYFIFDASQKHELKEFSGSLQKAIQKYRFKKSSIEKFLYSFNRQEYKEFI